MLRSIQRGYNIDYFETDKSSKNLFLIRHSKEKNESANMLIIQQRKKGGEREREREGERGRGIEMHIHISKNTGFLKL